MMFLTCLFLAGVLDLAWWRLASRRLRRAGVSRAWRWAWLLFMTLQFGGYLAVIVFRGNHAEPPLPGPLLVLVYTWHVFVLPLWMILWAGSGAMSWLVRFVACRVRRLLRPAGTTEYADLLCQYGPRPDPLPEAEGELTPRSTAAHGLEARATRDGQTDTAPVPDHGRDAHATKPAAPTRRDLIQVVPVPSPACGERAGDGGVATTCDCPAPSPDRAVPTRRDLIRAGVAAIPAVAGVFVAAGGVWQQELFEVVKLNIPVAGLPAELDGLRIAHVSDTHVGKFTSPAKLRSIAQAVNDLDTDLVAFTGDLIDHWMGGLDDGIALIRSFRSRHGTFLVEGNHDLMDDRIGFRWEVRRAGLRLLLNESATLRIRGQKTQILGIRWGASNSHLPLFEEHLAATLPLRDPAAFPIVIAHHPHTFDPAAAAGLPLVLCGHTHGGQLMLTRDIGPARILYKYLSGLYRRERTSLVVSNGVGNWFPLRINAPAQLAELTLRRENV
ncbi:MAG: metallophosphoesterase [Tepidisphaeraceae bacterium]|jgi:hypothetical protein